jgi:hypothetical protein
MAKNNSNGLIWILLILGVGIGAYFLFFANARGQCKVDADCGAGKTCSMGISGSAAQCIVPVLPSGDGRDGKCDTTKSTAYQTLDPDCPLYCPVGGRAGSSGMCCVNNNNTATVDCVTGAPLYPENWANLQAFVTFGPQGQTGTTTTRQTVTNTVAWTAPASYPTGVTILSLWLESVTVSPSAPAIAWTDANCARALPVTAGCFLKTQAFTGVIPGATGRWSANPLDMNALTDGTYTITYRYCVQDAAGTIIPNAMCTNLVYTLVKSAETISFSVAANLA